MKRILSTLRDGTFLSRERTSAYAWLLFAFMAAGLAFDYTSTALGHHPWGKITGSAGKPAATDFLAFWAAGRAVWAGHAADAYNFAALSANEHANAVLDQNVLLAFFYPPTFLLFCLPFAALPYLVGFAAFVFIPLAALAFGLRRILTAGGPITTGLSGYLPVLAFPGLLMNAATGQTGFWSASCFAWGLLWLRSRPILAGAALGMLVTKPHLALAVPVALAASRRWKALVACGATALGWTALSWGVLGSAAWRGFVSNAPAIRDALENHAEDWSKLQSLFTTVRLLGGSLGFAYAAQIGLGAGTLIVLAAVAWRRPGAQAEAAAIASAAMLCTPHILDYDLAATSVPLAWLAGRAMRFGWLPWEKTLAGLAFLWPLIARGADTIQAMHQWVLLSCLVCLHWSSAVPAPANYSG